MPWTGRNTPTKLNLTVGNGVSHTHDGLMVPAHTHISKEQNTGTHARDMKALTPREVPGACRMSTPATQNRACSLTDTLPPAASAARIRDSV